MALRTPASSEWVTRKDLIDKESSAAGWRVTPYRERALTGFERCALEEYPTDNGTADYALVLGSRVVGIVEAKKLTLGPQNVLSQAERYAEGCPQPGCSWGNFGVPLLYSTNGEVIWHHDVRDDRNRSRQVAHFHTPDALAEVLGRDVGAAEESVLALAQTNARLTQSILAKAFRGELVPTEAELERREGRSCETAAELPARIKAAQDGKAGVVRRGKQSRGAKVGA